MSVTILLRDRPVATSRNLRGILDYARRHPVDRVSVTRADGGAHLYVSFSNGAQCWTRFASFDVCKEWVMSRRSWAMEEAAGSLNWQTYRYAA